MGVVISIAAAWMMLGLAAFGVVSPQKMSAASPAAAHDSSSTPEPQSAVRRHQVNPVRQLAQNSAANVPSSGPNASAQPKPAQAANAIPGTPRFRV